MSETGKDSAEATPEQATDAEHLEEVIDEATETIAVEASRLEELSDESGSEETVGLDGLLGVQVNVSVEVGTARMSLGELVKLGPGSVLELDREVHEPADVFANGKLVARGEIVTVDGRYGVRITQLNR
jgi:flagellar motor switch protein FliN/FliY